MLSHREDEVAEVFISPIAKRWGSTAEGREGADRRQPGGTRAVQNGIKPRLAIIALAAMMCVGAAASDPAERLADPVKEAHARSLFRQIRCLICQNESIDESEAPIADDLRKLVRQQIVEGRSDGQIRQFLVQRFGAFVLLKPPFDLGDAPLWLAPFAIIGVGAAVIAWRSAKPLRLEPPLSDAERARLDALTAAAPASEGAELGDLDTVPPRLRLTKGAQA